MFTTEDRIASGVLILWVTYKSPNNLMYFFVKEPNNFVSSSLEFNSKKYNEEKLLKLFEEFIR